MKYALIAAMTPNRVIGHGNEIPWYLPEDLKLFKKITTGGIVIMGRKTWESIPEKFRPLRNRFNIILSTSVGNGVVHKPDGTMWAASFKDAVDNLEALVNACDLKVFVIGGQSLYEQTISGASELHISALTNEYNGDKFFPEINKDLFYNDRTEINSGFNYHHYKRQYVEY